MYMKGTFKLHQLHQLDVNILSMKINQCPVQKWDKMRTRRCMTDVFT